MKNKYAMVCLALALVVAFLTPGAYAATQNPAIPSISLTDAETSIDKYTVDAPTISEPPAQDPTPKPSADNPKTNDTKAHTNGITLDEANRFAPGWGGSVLYFTNENGATITQAQPNSTCLLHIRARYEGANPTSAKISMPALDDPFISLDDKWPTFHAVIIDNGNDEDNRTSIWSNFYSSTGSTLDFEYDTTSVTVYRNDEEYEHGIDWQELTTSHIGYTIATMQPGDKVEIVIPISVKGDKYTFATTNLDVGIGDKETQHPDNEETENPSSETASTPVAMAGWAIAIILAALLIYLERSKIMDFFTYVCHYNKS